MAQQLKRGGRRPPGTRNPVAFALSMAGILLVFLGLVVIDSLVPVVIGAALTLAGWLVARRSR